MIICPNCGSDNTELVFGGMLGHHRCNKCDFEGIFPEIDVSNDVQANKIKNKMRKAR